MVDDIPIAQGLLRAMVSVSENGHIVKNIEAIGQFVGESKNDQKCTLLETKGTNREKDAGKASEAPFACPQRLPNKPRRSKRLALPALELRCGVSSERVPIGIRWLHPLKKTGKGANKQKTSRLSTDNIHYIIFISHNPPIIPPFLSHGSMSKPWYLVNPKIKIAGIYGCE